MKVGDKVLISPDATHLSGWIPATIIKIEHNSFRGVIIVAETADGDVFFNVADLFKPAMEEELCLH